MKIAELSGLLLMATADGADKALNLSGLLPDTISQAHAFRIYGRSNVERWSREGLLVALDGQANTTKKTYDRKKLEAIAKASNRVTYLPVSERRVR